MVSFDTDTGLAGDSISWFHGPPSLASGGNLKHKYGGPRFKCHSCARVFGSFEQVVLLKSQVCVARACIASIIVVSKQDVKVVT